MLAGRLLREKVIPETKEGKYQKLVAVRIDNNKTYGWELSKFAARVISSYLEVEGRPSGGDGGSSAVDGLRRESGG